MCRTNKDRIVMIEQSGKTRKENKLTVVFAHKETEIYGSSNS
jgi:hypothetical protein